MSDAINAGRALGKALMNSLYGKMKGTVKVGIGPAVSNRTVRDRVPHGVRRVHIFDNHKIPKALHGKRLYAIKKHIIKGKDLVIKGRKYKKGVISKKHSVELFEMKDNHTTNYYRVDLLPSEYRLTRLEPTEMIVMKML